MHEDSLIEIQMEEAAQMIAAVSNGRRMNLIKILLSSEHNVGDLAMKIGLSQSATSQHLRILKITGILLQRKDAQIRFCRINPNMVSVLERLICIAEEGVSSVDKNTERYGP